MRRAIVTIALLATAGAVAAVSTAPAPATRPLTERLLHANEIAGYTPAKSTVKMLELEALASLLGRTPKQLASERGPSSARPATALRRCAPTRRKFASGT